MKNRKNTEEDTQYEKREICQQKREAKNRRNRERENRIKHFFTEGKRKGKANEERWPQKRKQRVREDTLAERETGKGKKRRGGVKGTIRWKVGGSYYPRPPPRPQDADPFPRPV